MYPSNLWLYAGIALVCFLVYRTQKATLPTGPRGLPLLGVAKELPSSEPWKTYAAWDRRYGGKGLISFHILGRRFVVINSMKVAIDLLSQRSLKYSDRPFSSMNNLMKRHNSIFQMPYNARLKSYRRLMQQAFNPVHKYWEIQYNEARVLVAKMSDSPEGLFEHLRRNAGAVIMKITYGYTIKEDKDHFIEMAEESMRIGSLAGRPGWMVDSFPILQYVPKWFPGANFKRQAEIWSHEMDSHTAEPYEYVKRSMANGTAVPSFTSQLLSEQSDPEREDLIRWTAGALYNAGTDTTVAVMKAFIWQMMSNPEIQRRAQNEVDSVIGKERRLPTLNDRPSMPYLELVLKEVLRWSAPAPQGVSHCPAQDDEYNGYFIPAKTTVIPNIWAMLYDPSVYPNPEHFDPERFDPKNPQLDPSNLVFGFGRRICPGQQMAESTLFIQMTMILAALDIAKPVDAKGKIIEQDISFTTSIVRHIQPFRYRITVRAPDVLALIQQDI